MTLVFEAAASVPTANLSSPCFIVIFSRRQPISVVFFVQTKKLATTMVKFTSGAVAAVILGISSYNGADAFAPLKSKASVSSLHMVSWENPCRFWYPFLGCSFHLEVIFLGVRRFHEESFSRFLVSFNFH